MHYAELAGNSDHKRQRHDFDNLSRRDGPQKSSESSGSEASLPVLEPTVHNVSDSSHDIKECIDRRLAKQSSRRAALASIRHARDKLLIAHTIQTEANKLFSEALAKATASGPKPSRRASEHVESAKHIATTANEKAKKARESLVSSIRQLAWVEKQQRASTVKSANQIGQTDDAFEEALDKALARWGLKSGRTNSKALTSTTTTGSHDSHTAETVWESKVSATSEDKDCTSVTSGNPGAKPSL